MTKLIKKFFSWGGIAPNEGGFIQAALSAAPYVLQGISALGGIFGKKKKYMDAEALRQMYGPKSVGRDTTDLANFIINSPYGQQLLSSAAESGQGLQTELGARAAAAGLSPDTGGQSGASDFAASAGTQAQSGLERQTKAGIFQAAMPIAAEMNAARMQAGLGAQTQMNADPTLMQRIGAAAGQTAASIPGKPAAPSAVAPTAAVPVGPVPGQTPTLDALARGPQAPAQFRNQPTTLMRGSLTNARSAGMRRGLVGGR